MDSNNTLSQFVVERIRFLRKEQGLTQEALSEIASLDIKYVNKLENYRHTARLETLEQLLLALGVTYSEFFKFDIQANSNLIDELLVALSNLPKDKQEKKIQAIIDLLKE
ncbi:helix-turn-helix domain-containing protein [Streptococcus suis]|uniref:helix-turn-helix domain-containing protein n=1 Tax=Streptococcus suis TaxID=1307 RepID=UPI0030101D9E